MDRRDFLERLVVLAPAPVLVPQAAHSSARIADDELQWVAGDLPPFAWQAGDGSAQGYAHDLALAMSQKLGRPGRVSFYPWARAVKMASEGSRFGVFPLARTPEREHRFRWLIPLMRVQYTFVGRAEDKPMTLDQLRRSPMIGVLRGSPIISNLQNEEFRNIREAKDYKDLLRMLNEKSLTAIYAGAPMLQAAIDEYGHSRAAYITHTTLGEATLYMGASLGLPEAEAERWIKAYQQLQADGSVARLQQRYLR